MRQCRLEIGVVEISDVGLSVLFLAQLSETTSSTVIDSDVNSAMN